MKSALSILVVLTALVFPLQVSAHPGRTDANGGHTCRTNCEDWGYRYGEYHYHNGGRISKPDPEPVIPAVTLTPQTPKPTPVPTKKPVVIRTPSAKVTVTTTPASSPSSTVIPTAEPTPSPLAKAQPSDSPNLGQVAGTSTSSDGIGTTLAGLGVLGLLGFGVWKGVRWGLSKFSRTPPTL